MISKCRYLKYITKLGYMSCNAPLNKVDSVASVPAAEDSRGTEIVRLWSSWLTDNFAALVALREIGLKSNEID